MVTMHDGMITNKTVNRSCQKWVAPCTIFCATATRCACREPSSPRTRPVEQERQEPSQTHEPDEPDERVSRPSAGDERQSDPFRSRRYPDYQAEFRFDTVEIFLSSGQPISDGAL